MDNTIPKQPVMLAVLVRILISAFCSYKLYVHYMDHLDFVNNVKPRSNINYQSHTNCALLVLITTMCAVSAILSIFANFWLVFCCICLCAYILSLPIVSPVWADIVPDQSCGLAVEPVVLMNMLNKYNTMNEPNAMNEPICSDHLSENPEHWILDNKWKS